MKPLKPSHREKKRYLLIKGSDADEKKIEKAILAFVGILGYAKASPQAVKKAKDRLILSVNRSELDKIRAALMLRGLNLSISRVSGTLKKLG